jgi:GNAT superfamily N-acetyltransferase
MHRRGIGTTLIGWAEDEAMARGCVGVSLGVLVALPGNLHFFERLGYRVADERRHEGYARTTWLLLTKDVVVSPRAES